MGLFSKNEKTPAQTVISDVCKVKKGESVLIIANPETNLIAQDLFVAANEAGASTTLIYQNTKSSMDLAEKSVIGALKSEPDVVLSISNNKLGKDSEAIAKPYVAENGETFDHIFDYLLGGKKTIRAVWTPGLTKDMFDRTVQIDYKLLGDRCDKLCRLYENAVSVHVTSPNGTDVTVPVEGRKGLKDNGDFSQPGAGGNIPAGEVFISPLVGGSIAQKTSVKQTVSAETIKKGKNLLKELSEVKDKITSELDSIKVKAEQTMNNAASGDGTGADLSVENTKSEVQEKVADEKKSEDMVQSASDGKETAAEQVTVAGTQGTIVFDGSMSFSDGDAMLATPITVKVENGFVSDISGGEEAKRLLKDITAAEKEAAALEGSGKLPKGQGQIYARNARNIGELGIGLNPSANVTGNMLEDEKAFRTCHFAIGMNYDGDAPALIHFDGIVRNPTIVITYADNSTKMILDKGDLKID